MMQSDKNMIFRGGARIGLWNATWPLAKLRLGSDTVSLKVLVREYIWAKSEIIGFEFFDGLFSRGVKITHSKQDRDSPIIFWSFAPREVLLAAQKLGIPIKRKKSGRDI
jgi:hypothetical protein